MTPQELYISKGIDMVEGLTGYKVNGQAANPYMKTGNIANGATKTGVRTFERSPQADNVQISSKQPRSKRTKTLFTLGGIAVVITGAVLAIKGYRARQISKGLKQVEQKFLKLQENMPEVQKTFKDVFLREDITEKEAAEMLNRYKEVEKLRVTGTKEEYIQAVFDEAKRNFGFADSKFKLVLKSGQVSKNGKTAGAAAHACARVEIDPGSKIEQIQGIMHHEMRHMKQNYYAVNYDPHVYSQTLCRGTEMAPLTEKELKEVLDSVLDDIKNIFNLKRFSKENIPKEQLKYAKECLEGRKTYVDGHTDYKAYYNNFNEVDARHAGGLIDKLFNGAVLGGNK